MKYPNLFKSRYPVLEGKDWIRTVDEEDRQAFIRIGLQETDYGRTGGHALVKKYGKKHMKNLAHVGAIMTNIRRAWKRAVEDETARLQEAQSTDI